MYTKETAQQARAKLEAFLEQDEMQAAIDLRSTLFQKYGEFACHIYTSGKGSSYSATLMLDDSKGATIAAVSSVEKFDGLYMFFRQFQMTSQEMDILAQQSEYDMQESPESRRNGYGAE